MRLYSGSSTNFIDDSVHNRIADKLRDAYFIPDRCDEGDGDRIVTFVGQADRDVLHPSIQVGQYKMYLEDGHTVFHEEKDPVALKACSYLHNYSFIANDPILASKFESALIEFPL